MQLTLTNVSYTYEGATSPALDQVSATFPSGWTGIVGDNGCGKSTLAQVATGLIMPDEGSVAPKLFATYCPQDTALEPAQLADFATDWGSDALRIRDALGIDDAWLWDYEHLSGGQKKRVQIAWALWQHPDMLVLDEPTNDLDAQTRECVLQSLRTFKGIGILISHDRALLDALVSQCAVFDEGRVIMRSGGYSKVAEQMRAERTTRAREHENARREERRLKAEAQRRSEEAARSGTRLSAKRLDKHDSDGRERLGRARVSSKDSVAGRAAGAMASRAQRASRAAAESQTSKRYDAAIQLPGRAVRSKFVLHIPEGDLRAGDVTACDACAIDRFATGVQARDLTERKPQASDQASSEFVLHVPELWVGPSDHVGVSGRNGAGKTTLLRHVRSLVPDQVEYAFIPQEVDGRVRQAALERLRSLDDAEKGRVLSLVAGLNTDPDALREGENISPGELKKLLIAEQLLREPNLLILDEPTNHLDVGSIEALERALATFPGAIILVTHDEHLLRAVSTLRWHLDRVENQAILRVN